MITEVHLVRADGARGAACRAASAPVWCASAGLRAGSMDRSGWMVRGVDTWDQPKNGTMTSFIESLKMLKADPHERIQLLLFISIYER